MNLNTFYVEIAEPASMTKTDAIAAFNDTHRFTVPQNKRYLEDVVGIFESQSLTETQINDTIEHLLESMIFAGSTSKRLDGVYKAFADNERRLDFNNIYHLKKFKKMGADADPNVTLTPTEAGYFVKASGISNKTNSTEYDRMLVLTGRDIDLLNNKLATLSSTRHSVVDVAIQVIQDEITAYQDGSSDTEPVIPTE